MWMARRPYSCMSVRAENNFESGGRRRLWGWKDAPSGLEALSKPGDLIAFGSGFDAGSPRVASEMWQKHQVADVTVGRITSPIERTDQLVMPDELTGKATYPWKIGSSTLELNKMSHWRQALA